MAFNLSNIGTPTFGAGGKFSNAVSGFSSSNYLRSTTSFMTAGAAADFRTEQWLKTSVTGNFVSLSFGTSDNFHMGVAFTGFFSVYIPSAGGWKSSGITISDGLWHHCVATYVSATNTTTMWVDGVKGVSVVGAITWANAAVVVGNIHEFTSVPWGGSIDETAFFSNLTGYTGASYTVPTAAYTGTETGLLQLYHFETDGTDSKTTGATTYTMTGPSSGTVLVASTNFTLTPDAAYTGTVTPNDNSGGGTFTPTSLTWAGDASAKTFIYTPATTGAKTIRATSSPGLTDPANLTYTSNSGAATTYTLTGPSGGLVGAASTNFTVTPNGLFTGTITPTAVAGCTFTPSSLTYSAESTAKTFTVTPSTSGVKTIATTNSGSLTNPGSVSYTASNTALFAFDAPSDNSLGAAVSGTTTWGNRAVVCNGTYTWFNRLVTGTDWVIPSYNTSSTTPIQITVSNPDGSSPVVTNPTLVTGSWQHNANIPVIAGLGSDTAKLVVIRAVGGGVISFDGDEFLKGTAIGTPLCALPAGHGEVIRMNALPSYVGREGVGADGGTLQTASGYQMVNSAINGIQVASLKHRLNGNITDYWIAVYGTSAVHHLNRVLGTGATPGVPLDAGNSITDAGTGNIQNWLHIATSLPSGTFIYELTAALPAGILLAAIMVGGGTGIDHTATGLVRTLKYVGMGDSTMNAVDGTNGAVLGRPDLGVLEWFSQNENCQVINGGLRGTAVTDWNANSYWNILSHLPSTPTRAVLCFLGVNDANAARTVAQLSSDYLTGMAAARTQLAGVPLLFQSINPCSSHLYSFYHAYNVGNGTDVGIQGDVAARRAGGDLLCYYLNIETGGLADPSYSTGGTFNTTNFFDFVHLNPTGQIVHAQLVQAAMNTLLATNVLRSSNRTSPTKRRGSRQMVTN